MLRTALATSLFALTLAPSALAHGSALQVAQQAEAPPSVTSEEVADGLYMLQGQGGNIGLLKGPDGAFVIDSQYAKIAEANLAKINELSGETPRFVLNTHWHGDHVGGNAAFVEDGATVLAHENVRARVSKDSKRGDRKVDAQPVEAWPVITFTRDMKLHLIGQTISVIHVANAHTDGDSIVRFEQANAYHMGDVMFANGWPFIDLDSGGSVDGYIAALDKIYAEADDETKIIPGHGPMSTRADVKKLADALRRAKVLVAPLVAKGSDVEEAKAAKPLAEFDGEMSWRFITDDRMVETLFKDISRGG